MDQYDGTNDRYYVTTFEDYVSKVERLQTSSRKPIVVMFSGGKDKSTGKSWCPDCVVAQPIVDSVVNSDAGKDFIFIYCNVGDREFWKDEDCIFRTDKMTLLKSIPTLLKIDGNRPVVKLVGDQCAKKNIVELMFESD